MSDAADPRRSPGGAPALRRATVDDYDAIHALHGEAVRGLAAGRYSREQVDAWSDWLEREAYERRLDAGCLFLLAEVDGTPRGYAMLDPEASRVRAVYVHPAVARRGVGAALLEGLEAAAREAELDDLHLEASLNAVPFYRARGWTEVEAGRHATLRGVELECVLMEKRLD